MRSQIPVETPAGTCDNPEQYFSFCVYIRFERQFNPFELVPENSCSIQKTSLFGIFHSADIAIGRLFFCGYFHIFTLPVSNFIFTFGKSQQRKRFRMASFRRQSILLGIQRRRTKKIIVCFSTFTSNPNYIFPAKKFPVIQRINRLNGSQHDFTFTIRRAMYAQNPLVARNVICFISINMYPGAYRYITKQFSGQYQRAGIYGSPFLKFFHR